jgi:hypothetical protein
MEDGKERPEAEGETRPQRGGEAATTRFGMEDGDNTDVPATGGPAGDEAAEREGGS